MPENRANIPEEFLKPYDPATSEPATIALWDKSGYTNPDNMIADGLTKPDAEPFSIVLPPPNVTGTLHMGHAAMLAVEDILVRYARMNGKRTLWIPGTDSAAIATQAKVEGDIYKKEKQTRYDLGRDELMKRIEAFTEESKNTIINQVRAMGASLDWSRYAYTMDESRYNAVMTAFVRMYEAGLIYRGDRIVNWDPNLQTTVSDDEIEWKEETRPFYYLKYGPFVIGTARPETKFGDKYVVMHPEDARYKEFTHGQTLELEWINGPITATVIKDEAIDMEFGTGVMTITPWHDAADFDIAERHKLDKEQVIDAKGKLLPIAGEFAGLHIKKARPAIVERLQTKGLIEKIDEKYVGRIATNSRGNGVIEPQIMKQWFVAVNKKAAFPDGKERTLKEWMREAIESGRTKITPERFEKIYFHWIDNLRDWCISRQIWFGHRIPVWYCGDPNTKRMGFAGDIVAQVFDTKTVTYRSRDHEWKVGDVIAFEDSAKKTIFGYGTITESFKTTVGEVDLQDKRHWKTYETREQLIAALNRHYPNKKFTNDSSLWVYAYSFDKNIRKGACGTMNASVTGPDACPSCGAEMQRDPDTLDTWFSSGLWTFSTLGWPDATVDLKTYHPTSVLETGYDIVFFWVARMILMSGFLLGDVPFKQVYLHGLVRDGKGQKMSKSLGNIIDPLDMTKKFGADATRLSLIIGAQPGNDLKLSEDRVRGYKHFANKLWNITRFVLESTSGIEPSEMNATDSAIFKEAQELAASASRNIDTFRLDLAADSIYHFVWDRFAAEIIEESKPIFKGDDAAAKASRARLLIEILTISLKLLHPFMPFVTEAIWQKLPAQSGVEGPQKDAELLMIAKWPR